MEEGHADVNLARTGCGSTPLIFSVKGGHWGIARLLLQHGANGGLLNHAGDSAVSHLLDLVEA